MLRCDDNCGYIYLCQSLYIYKISLLIYFIERINNYIYQSNSLDIVITMPGTLDEWSHNRLNIIDF